MQLLNNNNIVPFLLKHIKDATKTKSVKDLGICRDKIMNMKSSYLKSYLNNEDKTYGCTSYPFLQSHSIQVRSILSHLHGVAKEVVDHRDLFPLCQCFLQRCHHNVIDILIASFVFSLLRKFSGWLGVEQGQTRRVLPIWVVF